MVEQVNVRMAEDLAAQLDEYVAEIQLRKGEDVIVQRVDAVRIILVRFFKKRAERARSSTQKRSAGGRRAVARR